MDNNYEFPVLGESPKEYNKREVNDKAFYTAALSTGDPINNYFQAQKEIIEKGNSSLTDALNTQLQQSTDKKTKAAVLAIIQSEDLEPVVKQQALQQYAMSGTVEKNLRDAFLERTAIVDNSVSPSEKHAQDVVVDTLIQLDNDAKEQQKVLNNFYANLDSSKTSTFLGLALEFAPVLSGYSIAKIQNELMFKGEQSTWEVVKNSVWGAGSTQREIEDWFKALPIEKKKEATRKLIEIAKDLPGFDFQRWDKVRTVVEGSTNEFWETTGNIVGVLDAIGAGWMIKNPVKTVKWFKPADNFFRLRVPPTSPLGTAATANPKAGAVLAASAVMDDTGRLAEAMGTTNAEIINSFVLSKVDKEGLQVMPNLVKQIEKMSEDVVEAMQVSQHNTFLYNMTATRADVDKIHTFIRENELPIFNPANSTFNPAEILNQTESIKGYKGVATYSKTPDYGWTSLEEAQAAMAKQEERLKTLPEELRGSLEIKEMVPGQYFLQWNWEKKLDEVDPIIFGDNAISTKFMGFDVSALSRSTGGWLFGQYDRVKRWVYGGATQAEYLERFADNALLKPLIQEVAQNKYGKEIGHLLVKGGKTVTAGGGKRFTYKEVLDEFPNKSVEEVKQIYEGYQVSRAIADYHYLFSNALDRKSKALRGMQTIYDADGSVARYAKVVPDDEKADLLKTITKDKKETSTGIIDLDNDSVIMAHKSEGRQIVKLDRPMEVEGRTYEFAAVGKAQRVGPLPAKTLPYIEGYFPRKYKENFWVDIVRKNLIVNDKVITDAVEKANRRHAVRAFRTEKQAREFQQAYMKENPDYEATVRVDRNDSERSAVDHYMSYAESWQRARSRGEHIMTDVDTLADTEDPLLALIQSVRSLAKRQAWSDWKDAFQDSFVKEYKQFVTKGQFPRSLEDLVNLPRASKEETQAFQNAVQNFKYYQSVTELAELRSDRIWNASLSKIADILDEKTSWKTDYLRELGRRGNIPVRALQKLGTILFIFTNPIRQVVVQSQQMIELAAMTPSSAKDVLVTNMAILARLAGDKMGGFLGKAMIKSSGDFAKVAGYSTEEFNILMKQFRESGIIQSVDSNMILHGMFNSADKALTNSFRQDLVYKTGQAIAAPVKVGKLGFDLGELTNMTGAWLWARKRMINQGMDVSTPEALAQIAVDARTITGSMTNTGAMPYQKGVLAIPMQFASVGHKLFLQPFTSKMLSDGITGEGARLFATRLAFYGAYGTGAAAGFEWLRDKYYDKLDPDTWKFLMNSVMDIYWNNILEYTFGKKDINDLSISPSITPVSKYGLPYIEFLHAAMKGPDEFANKIPFSNIAGRFNQLWYDLNLLTKREDIDTAEKAIVLIPEILKLSSGFSNYTQAQTIIETGKLVDKFGNQFGMDASWKTAVGKVLSFTAEAEIASWDATKMTMKRRESLEKDAKMYHNSAEKFLRANNDYNDVMKHLKMGASVANSLPERDRDLFWELWQKEDKMAMQERGFSVVKRLDEMIRTEANTDAINMVKRLKDSGLPAAKDALQMLQIEGIAE